MLSNRVQHLKVFTMLYLARATVDPRPLEVVCYLLDTLPIYAFGTVKIGILGQPSPMAVRYLGLEEVARRVA